MPLLIVTLCAHIIFTMFNIYWIIPWSDNVVHFCMGMGLVLLFMQQVKWGTYTSIIAVLLLALGWEYVEQVYEDMIIDVLCGLGGAIIGSIYARRT